MKGKISSYMKSYFFTMFKIKNKFLNYLTNYLNTSYIPFEGSIMDYYNEIKEKLINNVINKKVKNYFINRYDLDTYYNVGKLLNDAGKQYGESIIKDYSNRLTIDLGIKYDTSSLNKMRKFYNLVEKMATVSPNLSYSHYVELLPYKDINKVKYYVRITEEYNLSIRELRAKIKSNEYERIPQNTKNKLIDKNELNILDYVKNPIVIKNNNYEFVSEKVLQKLILEDIPYFLEELGRGFTFIKNEYKIKLDDRYNYVDLLLFNIDYNCYVVVELKVTELKKEHIGQIQVYMNYIDHNLKKSNHNKTIGIIICKQDNSYVIKYCSDNRIISRNYEIIS